MNKYKITLFNSSGKYKNLVKIVNSENRVNVIKYDVKIFIKQICLKYGWSFKEYLKFYDKYKVELIKKEVL
ncbi:MAG: hypothetical protein HUJ97_09015 [Bacteroidales bacterium]|nr:hypothetical protein [Clostridia bacterium]MCF0180363.1 hypothetical protein [Bacteroidales bacterium]